MEFCEKLQELRKQKGLTQEELSAALYVSRTAVSKWESGRGYPGIDSLKAISKYFGVTIDALLSGEELLSAAEEENKEKAKNYKILVFGLLDLSLLLFFFLPFFGQKSGGGVQAVSLLSLTEISLWLKILYLVFTLVTVTYGIVSVTCNNINLNLLNGKENKISIILNTAGVFLFIISLQPYAASFLFTFLIIKVLITFKK